MNLGRYSAAQSVSLGGLCGPGWALGDAFGTLGVALGASLVPQPDLGGPAASIRSFA